MHLQTCTFSEVLDKLLCCDSCEPYPKTSTRKRLLTIIKEGHFVLPALTSLFLFVLFDHSLVMNDER